MDGVKVNVRGLDELERALQELGAEVGGKELRKAMNYAARPTRKAILDSAPVKTGNLRGKVRTSTAVNKRGVTNGRWAPGETVRTKVGVFKTFYAHFLEFGTSKQAATPFLRPAFLNEAPKFVDQLKRRLASGIKKVKAKRS